MDKDLIENKLYKIIDQFNERKTTPVQLYAIVLKNSRLFYGGNGRTSKSMFASETKIINLIDETKKIKNEKLIK